MEIKYIGGKQLKKDNISHTGVVWRGHGDVQEVPDSAAVALLAYQDIWVRVDHKPALPEFKFSENKIEAIAEAIGLLDPKSSEHYTKLNQPRVEAIEMLLGYDITTVHRDEGYFLYQSGEHPKELTPPEGEDVPTEPEVATTEGEGPARFSGDEVEPPEPSEPSEPEDLPGLKE